MQFRIAHLMWLIAICAVYFGLARLCRENDGWVDRWVLPFVGLMLILFYGTSFLVRVSDA